jgi:hypothetical protein
MVSLKEYENSRVDRLTTRLALAASVGLAALMTVTVTVSALEIALHQIALHRQ